MLIKIEEKDLVQLIVFLNNIDFHARNCYHEDSDEHNYWVEGICSKAIIEGFTFYQIDRIVNNLELSLIKK